MCYLYSNLRYSWHITRIKVSGAEDVVEKEGVVECHEVQRAQK